MDIVYKPKGRAAEYSGLAVNPYKGCGWCDYCYLKNMPGMSTGKIVPIKNFLKRLERDCKKLSELPESPKVFMSFLTDPYNPIEEKVGNTRGALKLFNQYGIPFRMLTKNGLGSLRDVEYYRTGIDDYGVTLTSFKPNTWEIRAPLPAERIHALEEMNRRGIWTWISFEPILMTTWTLEAVEHTAGIVDEMRFGRLNYHKEKAKVDWVAFKEEVVELVKYKGVEVIWKESLQFKEPYQRRLSL